MNTDYGLSLIGKKANDSPSGFLSSRRMTEQLRDFASYPVHVHHYIILMFTYSKCCDGNTTVFTIF